MASTAELIAAATRVGTGLPRPPWRGVEADDAVVICRRLKANLDLAAHRVAAAGIQPGFPFSSGFDAGLFGTPWLGHGLRNPPLLASFRPHEPQLIQMLAHHLSPSHFGEIAAKRARAFIAALFRAAGQPAPDFFGLAGLDARLVVETERRMKRGLRAKGNRDRRIDLLLRWSDADRKPCGVVVEAKFGACVAKGQLPAQRAHAMDALGGLERCRLFVVGRRHDRLAARNGDWMKVNWFDVIRHWETELATNGSGSDDVDADFARFRASLWQQSRESAKK